MCWTLNNLQKITETLIKIVSLVYLISRTPKIKMTLKYILNWLTHELQVNKHTFHNNVKFRQKWFEHQRLDKAIHEIYGLLRLGQFNIKQVTEYLHLCKYSGIVGHINY